MTCAKLFMLNLRGGGADLACDHCLSEAKRERRDDGSLVSVAPIDAPGDECPYCGISQGEEHDREPEPRIHDSGYDEVAHRANLDAGRPGQ